MRQHLSKLYKKKTKKKRKESSLILDCKTRWNNLEAMIERFITLKECDIGASRMWNEAYYPKIIELLNVLGPVRLAARP
jgi:hypothetical protein